MKISLILIQKNPCKLHVVNVDGLKLEDKKLS